MNNIKFTSEICNELFEQLALGKSIKSALKDKGLSWEGFRKHLLKCYKKGDKTREKYNQAKMDGIDYILDNGIERLEQSIIDLKDNPNQRASLAISNLQKEIIGLIKFKSSALLPKYNPKSQVNVGFNGDKPLIVKWSDK